MKNILLYVTALLSLMACQKDDAPDEPEAEKIDIPITDLFRGSWGAEYVDASAKNYIINSQEQWDSFFYYYYMGSLPYNADYGANTVIIAVSNVFPNIGEFDDYTITSVYRQNDTVNVVIHAFVTVEGNKVPQTYQRYHSVSIPKTRLPVKFKYEP
jgi:hypothetical protein